MFVEGTRSRRLVGLVVGQPLPTDGLSYRDRDALLARAQAWFELQQVAVDAVESQA